VTQTVPGRSLTVKGERTRGKIVDTAATLMLNDGVAGTTIEGVCAAAGVGRSQVYHYFDDKSELVRAVIERQAELIFGGRNPISPTSRGGRAGMHGATSWSRSRERLDASADARSARLPVSWRTKMILVVRSCSRASSGGSAPSSAESSR
jgi:AcrR family transcriptional regulator